MIANFSKEEIIEIIQDYYRKNLNMEVEVNIMPKVCAVDMYDNLGSYTAFEVTRWVVLGSKIKKFTEQLTEEDILKIFKSYFKPYNLVIENLEIRDCLVNKQTGYGTTESMETTAVFKGILVTVATDPQIKLERLK